MNSLEKQLQQKLSGRTAENSLRELKISLPGSIDFFSNDYLGFVRDFSSSESIWPTGSTGSRLLGGNSKIHEDTEAVIATFHQSPAALIFNSGYAANTGLFSCLLTKADTYIYDELCHASIRDGIRLNPATAWSFAHNDLKDLEKKLKLAQGKKVVIVESVYSMDGDFAPLKEIASLCEKYDAVWIADEAHAVGVFGKNGEGRVVEENLQSNVFASIITFGKALGVHGAAVLGSEDLRNYLINFSRPFIYTTALSPQSIQHIHEAYEKLRNNPEKRTQLRALIRFYREEMNTYPEIKKNSTESFSSIQTIIIPGNDAVKALSKKLGEQKIDVRPILSPTVPKGKERLRICLHTFNTESEIAMLLKQIQY